MSKRLTFLSAAAVVCALAAPAVAEDVNAETVIATVNGAEIKLGHLMVTRQNLPQQYQHLPAEVLFPGILDQIIQQIVLEQSLPSTLPLSVQYSLENQRRTTLANRVMDDTMAVAVTDEVLQAEYDATYGNADAAMEYNAAHILVETEDAAKALTDEARGGADFAELAKANSTGPSGPNGGSLGWFGAGMMVKPFEDAVMGLSVGDISDPVQTQFGWHVIKLNETRQKDAPELAAVRDELAASIQRRAVETKITELTASATIDRSFADTLDPSVMDQADLLPE